jgi:hypothetical protein
MYYYNNPDSAQPSVVTAFSLENNGRQEPLAHDYSEWNKVENDTNVKAS